MNTDPPTFKFDFELGSTPSGRSLNTKFSQKGKPFSCYEISLIILPSFQFVVVWAQITLICARLNYENSLPRFLSDPWQEYQLELFAPCGKAPLYTFIISPKYGAPHQYLLPEPGFTSVLTGPRSLWQQKKMLMAGSCQKSLPHLLLKDLGQLLI